MITKLNRAIGVVLVFFMFASVFLVSCQKTNDTTSKETSSGTSIASTTGAESETAAEDKKPSWLQDTSPVTITWFTSNGSSLEGTWGTNLVTKYIQEKTGVHIELRQGGTDPTDAINTMIASNTLPDVIEIMPHLQCGKDLIDGGLVWSLNELSDKYDPTFMENANKQILEWRRYKDGNYYFYPSFSFPPNTADRTRIDSVYAFLVRKDIYEAIGSPDMSQPEGFLAALKAAKEKFPKALNGDPLIPFSTGTFSIPTGIGAACDTLTNQLPMNLATPYFDNAGNFVGEMIFLNDEVKRWMKTFQQASKLGYISREMFTDSDEQLVQKASNGRVFAFLWQRSQISTTAQANLSKNNPESVYIAVKGICNTKGDDPTYYGGGIGGWLSPLVTKNAKNPDRIIKFLNYLTTDEGQMDLQLGKQGETWDYNEKGKASFLPEYDKLRVSDFTKFATTVGGAYSFSFMFNPAIRDTTWLGDVPEGPDKQPLEFTFPFVKNASVFSYQIESGTEEEKILMEWQKRLIDYETKLILAKTDEEFENLWGALLKVPAEIGMDKVVAYETKKVNENKVKLGIN